MRSPLQIIAAGACLLLILVLLVYSYISPQIYSSSLSTAAIAGDYTTLLKRMDIDRVRESLSSEVAGDFAAELRNMGGINLPKPAVELLNISVKKFMLDSSNSPQKIANLLGGKGLITQEVLESIPSSLRVRRSEPEISGKYVNTDLYLSTYSYSPSKEEAVVIMERSGWFTWHAVGIKLSSNSLLWPIRRQAK